MITEKSQTKKINVIKKLITGGQTGADISALKAAFDLGIETGGTCPKDFMTELGSNYELRDVYKLKATNDTETITRTIQNIEDSDATIIFKAEDSKCLGTEDTIIHAKKLKKPCLLVNLNRYSNVELEIQKVKDYLNSLETLNVLNVGGNRESNSGFEEYSDMVYRIVYESIKPIYIPPEVVELIIQSCIINTNPFLIKSTLHTFARVSKDWNSISSNILNSMQVNYLKFNPNSYLNLHYAGEKLTSNYTVEFWLKKEEYDDKYPSMSILNDPFCSFKLEQFAKRKNIGFTKYGEYDKMFDFQLSSEWTHIAFSSSKEGLLRLYINGKCIQTFKKRKLNFHCPLGWIGGEAKNSNLDQLIYGFKGFILEFKVWNIERNEQEILDEMYHVYPKHKNLQFYMMFSDGLIYDYCSKTEMKEKKNIEEITPKGQPILITGAASGIGLETANLLASKGFFVYATDINQKQLESVFSNKENIKTMKLDVTVQQDIDEAVKTIQKEKGNLFGLVNNAGVTTSRFQEKMKSVAEMDHDKEILPVFEINVFGIMRMVSSFLGLLRVNKQEKPIIVNIASIAGRIGLSHVGMYSATKYAVVGYSESLRKELKNHVRVVTIQPTFTDTPILEVLKSSDSTLPDFEKTYQKRRRMLKKIPLLKPNAISNQIYEEIISDPCSGQRPITGYLDAVIYKLSELFPTFIGDRLERMLINNLQ